MRYVFLLVMSGIVILLFSAPLLGTEPTPKPVAPAVTGTAVTSSPVIPVPVPKLTLRKIGETAVAVLPVTNRVPEYIPPQLDISGVLFHPQTGSLRPLTNTEAALTLETVVPAEQETLEHLLSSRGIYVDADAVGIFRTLNPEVKQATIPAGQHLVLPLISGGPNFQQAKADGYQVVLLQNYRLKRHFLFTYEMLNMYAKRLPEAVAQHKTDKPEWDRLDAITNNALSLLNHIVKVVNERNESLKPQSLQKLATLADGLTYLVASALQEEFAVTPPLDVSWSKDDVEAAYRLVENMQTEARPFLPMASPNGHAQPPLPIVRVKVKVVNHTSTSYRNLVIHYVAEALWNRRNEYGKEFPRLGTEGEIKLEEADYIFWAEVPGNSTPVTVPKSVQVRCKNMDANGCMAVDLVVPTP